MGQIFISYAREDERTARQLYEDLLHRGQEPWIDSVDLLPGIDWKEAISEAITSSSYFLALISINSVNKRGFVQKELRQGLAILDEIPPNEIYIIPVRLDPVAPSHTRLKELHWVDLFDSYQTGLGKIMSAVSAERALVSRQPRPSEKRVTASFGRIGRSYPADSHSDSRATEQEEVCEHANRGAVDSGVIYCLDCGAEVGRGPAWVSHEAYRDGIFED